MASKLRLWGLDSLGYERVAYFDSDAVATERVPGLFEDEIWRSSPGIELVGEGGTKHTFVNAGVLVLRPSTATFEALLAHAEAHDPPGLFPNLVDCE